MRGLPPMCFLGTDATLWIIHNIHAVKSRAEAVQLGQVRRISSAPGLNSDLFNFAISTNCHKDKCMYTLHTNTHTQWLEKSTTARASYVSLL